MANQIPVRIKNYYTNYIDEQLESIAICNEIAKTIYGETLSKNTGKSKHFIIITSGTDIDALVSAPFAMYLEDKFTADCPVLLTQSSTPDVPQTQITQDTAALLKSRTGDSDENLFDTIYIIGGEDSMPNDFIGNSNKMTISSAKEYKRKSGMTYQDYNNGELLRYTTTVIRISGADVISTIDNRYTTSLAIANKMTETNTDTSKNKPIYLFFCNGAETIDGYSIATAACYLKSPLIYLPDLFSTDSEMVQCKEKLYEYLRTLAGLKCVKKIFIAGGNQRNCLEIEEKLRTVLQLTMPNSVERIGGQDRFDTSLSIAKEFNDFLSQNKTNVYLDRPTLLNNTSKCSKLILINSDSLTNDAPTAPMLAVYYKCPIILNAYQDVEEEGHHYIKPQHRYYNLMSYLEIKRPQYIYCFSNNRINRKVTSASGLGFENFVKFYNGTLKYFYNTGTGTEDNRYFDVVFKHAEIDDVFGEDSNSINNQT